MKKRHLEILQHSLGVDQYGRGNQYRNRFVTGPLSTDWPDCMELTELGFMRRREPHEFFGMEYLFTVTDAGKIAMATMTAILERKTLDALPHPCHAP